MAFFFSFFPLLQVWKNTSSGMLWLGARLKVQSKVRTIKFFHPRTKAINYLNLLRLLVSSWVSTCISAQMTLSWGYLIVISMASAILLFQQLLWCFKEMLVSKAQLVFVTWLLGSSFLWIEIFHSIGRFTETQEVNSQVSESPKNLQESHSLIFLGIYNQ